MLTQTETNGLDLMGRHQRIVETPAAYSQEKFPQLGMDTV